MARDIKILLTFMYYYNISAFSYLRAAGVTGCDWAAAGVTGCDWAAAGVTGCDWAAVSVTGCDWAAGGVTGCDWAAGGVTGCDWAAGGVTGCDWARWMAETGSYGCECPLYELWITVSNIALFFILYLSWVWLLGLVSFIYGTCRGCSSYLFSSKM